MRVRPFFWCLLAVSCISVLIFAATTRTHAPAIMQVRLDQQPPGASGITTLELHLADPQGLPIEHAQVLPSAKMTNMDMVTNKIRVESLGKGNYVAQLQLFMALIRAYTAPPPASHGQQGEAVDASSLAQELRVLTPRELEVLRLVAEGRTNQEIADQLVLSIKTVQTHRANVMEKLGLRDITHLVRFAIRHGLISPEP